MLCITALSIEYSVFFTLAVLFFLPSIGGFERQLTSVGRGIFSASRAFCLLSGVCIPSHAIPRLSANFVHANWAPLLQKSHKSVSFRACFLSEHHLARTSFNYYVPLLRNGSRSIEGLIRTSRISCKTHKGSREGVALNSPFIGQQIKQKEIILRWKMMFYTEFFKPCLSDNPVQK